MGMVCFVVDLPSLSPPFLAEFQQCLLQLANYYAISSSYRFLKNRIALCYVFHDRVSDSSELKVAYSPRGDFNLRDFHHAVKNLPTDAFSPETSSSDALCSRDIRLSSILHDHALYSWASEDVARKVVVVSSYLPNDKDSSLHKSLMDAADKCISVEFLVFEARSSHLHNVQESANDFAHSISDLDNCSIKSFLQDARVLHGLVKRWLQDLKDETEEQLHAQFIFNNNLVGSVNQIFCNLSASARQMNDFFNPCQACRCHGTVLSEVQKTVAGKICCPVTGYDLASSDVIEDTLRVGEKVILFIPSLGEKVTLPKISSPINFHVIERTSLGSLCEGILFGTPYVVTPSAGNEMGEIELNTQILQGICKVLHSQDQGLVCYSNYNVEAMKNDFVPCYYILEPSENGPMLLRHLAGLEEVLPNPDFDKFCGSVPEEIEQSIKVSLQMVELKDYDPLQHCRGFHQNLNSLVEESILFGSIPPTEKKVRTSVNYTQPEPDAAINRSIPPTEKKVRTNLNSTQPEPDAAINRSIPPTEKNVQTNLNSTQPEPDAAINQVHAVVLVDSAEQDTASGGANAVANTDKTPIVLDDEWEQLVITEVPLARSSKYTYSKEAMVTPSDRDVRRQDLRTSRILERLETPRQLKAKAVSPSEPKPVIAAGGGTQLIVPNFNRLKRKHK